MSKQRNTTTGEEDKYAKLSPEEAYDLWAKENKDVKTVETGMRVILSIKQILEMADSGENRFNKYQEPYPFPELLEENFRNIPLLKIDKYLEDVGVGSEQIISLLIQTKSVLLNLKKHEQKAIGKKQKELKKLIAEVEEIRTEGIKIGNDGLTLQTFNWFHLQQIKLWTYRDLYPDIKEDKKVATYRMSKTLNNLTNAAQKEIGRQFKLWEELDNNWRTAIGEPDRIETKKGIAFGADLDPSEHALIDTLYVLLWRKSETKNSEAEDYYLGDIEPVKRKSGLDTPSISFSEYELANTYNGDKEVGGKNVSAIMEIVDRLADKKFAMEAQMIVKTGTKKTTKTITTYEPLITYEEIKLEENDSATGQRREAKLRGVRLHPFFILNLREQYIELPIDIRERTKQAVGIKPSKTFFELRNYLLNEVSSKRKESQIDLSTAYERFCFDIERPIRKKEYLEKALEQCKKLRILNSYEETIGAAGQKKLLLSLNKDWAREPLKIEG